MRCFLAFAAALAAFSAPALAQGTSGVTPADRNAISACVRESGEMPRACIGTIAVVCAREPGRGQDAEIACARREAAVWRERLDLALSTFAERLQSGPRSRLVALQRSWEGYVAQKCAFAAEIQPPARAAQMQAACELRDVAVRAMEIERMLRRHSRPGGGRPQIER